MSDAAIRPTSSSASLAAGVRQFASQARGALVDPSAKVQGGHDLMGRIAELQAQVQGQPPSELTRWLENLRRRVEAGPGEDV
jgi:hypothetical protein